MPAIRPDVLESLVHPIPVNRVGGDVQLVVRVSVGTDDDSSAVEDPVEAVLAEVSPMPQRPAAAGHADLVRFCAELTRAVGDDDLAGAISLIATVADCPAALLRADRSVLTVGEPRRAARNGTPSPAARSWRWAANGPQGDREIALWAVGRPGPRARCRGGGSVAGCSPRLTHGENAAVGAEQGRGTVGDGGDQGDRSGQVVVADGAGQLGAEPHEIGVPGRGRALRHGGDLGQHRLDGVLDGRVVVGAHADPHDELHVSADPVDGDRVHQRFEDVRSDRGQRGSATHAPTLGPVAAA